MSLTKGTPASSQIIWLESRVQELEQKLAEAKKKYLQVCEQHGRLVDQVYEEDGETLKHVAAEAELAACKADADRYRWLRNRFDACAAYLTVKTKDTDTEDFNDHWVSVEQDAGAGEKLDAAIDKGSMSTDTPKWDCKDGTPDEDHDWRRKSDWYGDAGVINGTCTFHFKVCRVCGKEAEDDGDYDDYDEDYRHD